MDVHAFLQGLDDIMNRHAAATEADDYLMQAMADAENAGDREGLLTVLNETMGFYRSQSRHDDNQWIVQQALELGSQLGIENSDAWTSTLINAATAQRAAQHYDQAEDLYGQAIAQAQRTYGPYDRRLAALHNNMSMLYSETNRLEQAEEELERALEILKADNALQSADIDAASTYTNLALVELSQAHAATEAGDSETAQAKTAQAHANAIASLDIYREGHHEGSAHFAAALAGYAQTCYAVKDYAGATRAYRRALEVIDECYGRNTDYYRVTESNLRQAEQMLAQSGQAHTESDPDASTPISHAPEDITGMELSKRYWNDVVKPMVRDRFPQLDGRVAAGLVGHGSECYGFDDAISRDHDFYPRVCLWLTDEDYAQHGATLQQAYEELPKDFLGFHKNVVTARTRAQRRDGVFAIPAFFESITGYPAAPDQDAPHAWLMLSEATLAAATNGRVFADPLGAFSKARQSFLLMPRDVQLSLISRRLGMAAQAGQANLPRMLAREDASAAHLCVTEFVNAVSSLVFLCNNPVTAGYLPYYKWQFAALRKLSRRMGMRLTGVTELLERTLAVASPACAPQTQGDTTRQELAAIIERICTMIVAYLNESGLSTSTDVFLENQRPYVEAHIESDDPVLHSL